MTNSSERCIAFSLVIAVVLCLMVPSSEATFVTKVGNRFFFGGLNFTSYGSTMYPAWKYAGKTLYGGGWVYPSFTSYIDTVLSVANQASLNTIRPTDYFSGVAGLDIYNATVWANMDYLLSSVKKYNMFVVMDLSPLRNLYRDVYATMPYNAALWTDFVTWVGNRYRNEPAILMYSIAGEVPCPTSSTPTRPPSTQALTNFYANVTATLAAADPNHLITAGKPPRCKNEI